MSRNLSENTAAAWGAVRYTASRLTIGRGNNLSDNLDLFHPAAPALCVTEMRIRRAHTVTISEIAAQAERFRCGNCGEQAAVAMIYLHRQGIRPLEYMTLTNGDHTFVVIDRAANSNAGQPETWGATAVVCDPWSRQVYRAGEISSYMRGMCHNSSPVPQSINRVS